MHFSIEPFLQPALENMPVISGRCNHAPLTLILCGLLVGACSQAPDQILELAPQSQAPITVQGTSLQAPLSASGATRVGSATQQTGQSRFDLAITSVSVSDGVVWQLNRPIDITFDRAIDFTSVNSNTIIIGEHGGGPAYGSYEQPLDSNGQPRLNVLRFVPGCPMLDDFSDAGLAIGGDYSLVILGEAQTPGGITITGASGAVLKDTTWVDFSIVDSMDPATLFMDPVAGPPRVMLIPGAGGHMPGSTVASTYLEVGGDDTNRYYFGNNGLGSFQVPLNLYSDLDSKISLVLHLNQPVFPTDSNVNPDNLSFEFEESPGMWSRIPTDVSVVDNCSGPGSILRADPTGLLPQDANLRVVLKQGFKDITGEATLQDNTGFALMATSTLIDAGGQPDEGADELLENFVTGGSFDGSWEDTTTALSHPRAHWGRSQKLEAKYNFGGTGGPGGDFDYFVPAGSIMIINTTLTTIVGGPGGTPASTQVITNGVIDLRDLYVAAGAKLIFQGPNPATILATGNVHIEGEILNNGAAAPAFRP